MANSILENHEKRIGRLEVETGKLITRINVLESSLKSSGEDMKEIKETVSEISVSLAGIKASLKWSMALVSVLSALAGGLITWLITYHI